MLQQWRQRQQQKEQEKPSNRSRCNGHVSSEMEIEMPEKGEYSVHDAFSFMMIYFIFGFNVR